MTSPSDYPRRGRTGRGRTPSISRAMALLGRDLRAIVEYMHGSPDGLDCVVRLLRRFHAPANIIRAARLYYARVTRDKLYQSVEYPPDTVWFQGDALHDVSAQET